MGKLSSRLQQLRQMREGAGQRKSPSTGADGSTDPRRPSKTAQSNGAADERRLWPGWELVRPYVWKKVVRQDFGPDRRRCHGLLLDSAEDIERLRFYDFETTGLSGGAGTVIFLAGFAAFTSEGLEVEQLLLTDYPGEVHFLEEIQNLLSPEHIYVSFNGKSFDSNILRNRFRIHGMKADMPRQLDLLHPARRLWKRVLPSCSLQQIERDILGTVREGDISGELIPQCYQDFLAGRDDACMRRVAEHHFQDILSLAELLFRMETYAEEQEQLQWLEARVGVGLLLLHKEDPRGLHILEQALQQGCERAGRLLVHFYKKRKEYEEVRRLLRKMLDVRPAYFQVVEMAKLLEHRQDRPEEAFSLVEDFLNGELPLNGAQHAALLHRKQRLLSKKAKGES